MEKKNEDIFQEAINSNGIPQTYLKGKPIEKNNTTNALYCELWYSILKQKQAYNFFPTFVPPLQTLKTECKLESLEKHIETEAKIIQWILDHSNELPKEDKSTYIIPVKEEYREVLETIERFVTLDYIWHKYINSWKKDITGAKVILHKENNHTHIKYIDIIFDNI